MTIVNIYYYSFIQEKLKTALVSKFCGLHEHACSDMHINLFCLEIILNISAKNETTNAALNIWAD